MNFKVTDETARFIYHLVVRKDREIAIKYFIKVLATKKQEQIDFCKAELKKRCKQ